MAGDGVLVLCLGMNHLTFVPYFVAETHYERGRWTMKLQNWRHPTCCLYLSDDSPCLMYRLNGDLRC